MTIEQELMKVLEDHENDHAECIADIEDLAHALAERIERSWDTAMRHCPNHAEARLKRDVVAAFVGGEE